MFSVWIGGERRADNIPYAEDAAMLVSCLGHAAEVRYGAMVVWTEGAEGQSAGESYDDAAATMWQRVGRR